ncbi:hypothetical protein KUTeg_012177, partial [Tegillarca granosa]
MEADVSKGAIQWTDVVNSASQNVGWTDWAYTGVDFSLAGNGGDDCVDFLSIRQRIIESIFVVIISGVVLYRAVTRLTLPEKLVPADRLDHCGKRILLVVMCLTFGIELGFKFATQQMIYILNPCHLVTMLQIFCLAAPPSRLVTAVFRFHIHILTGAPIAILFPVINTRLLPFETEVYYIQHILMLVIPFYLMRIGGVYTPEPYFDFTWAQLSMTTVSKVNLNNMLCPAVSDPFYGPWYRMCAIFHQTVLINTLGKFYVWLATKFSLRKISQENEVYVFKKRKSGENKTNCSDINGKSHKDNSIAVNGKNGVVIHTSHERNSSNAYRWEIMAHLIGNISVTSFP